MIEGFAGDALPSPHPWWCWEECMAKPYERFELLVDGPQLDAQEDTDEPQDTAILSVRVLHAPLGGVRQEAAEQSKVLGWQKLIRRAGSLGDRVDSRTGSKLDQ